MREFMDYFDPKYRNMPYRSAGEEMDDYLRLLDMILEGYMEYKKPDTEEKLFSRGLVITESEMKHYFSMPPYYRERDICDPVLATAAAAARDYIENRTARTLGLPGTDILGDELSDPDDLADPEGNLTLSEEKQNTDSAARLIGDAETEDVPQEEDAYISEDESAREWDPDDSYGEHTEVGILWIDSLKQIFALDQTGVMAVVLAMASASDRRYERIFGYLQDDISSTRPTVGLLNSLMARITPRNYAGEMPVGLLDESLFTSLFVSTEEDRGLRTELILNPLLRRIMAGMTDDEMQMPEAVTWHREDADIPLFFRKSRKELERILSNPRHRFCYVENEDEDTVLHMMHSLALDLDVPLFVLDLKQMLRMSRQAQTECLADLALRLRLGNGLLSVRYTVEESEESGDEHRELAARRWRMLERISRLYDYSCIVLFGGKEEPGELIVRSVPFLPVPAPDIELRMEMWTYFLGERDGVAGAEDIVIEDLADCYDISYSMIRNTVSHARSAAGILGLAHVSRRLILDSLRQLGQVDFSGLASYVKASYTWDDITINDDQRAVLKIACDRYRLRNRVGQGWGLTRKNAYGNGVSLLMYGPPGTGKTMAAQVVSNELGIPLYRVDISRIFSKYIGETEKNLSIIFDAAKGSNVILFFDEADALFSKRTDIGTSNDKYANSETAYLLQKIEEYDGMSILATNLYANFDTAFVRRITYAVRLDSPDAEARYSLWTSMLPETAKVEEDIPFRFLAGKFELSGANIKAILFGAAYMAGAEGRPVGIGHIVRSMEYEYRKLGRFIDREAFGPYAVYLSMPGRTTAGNAV
ncbi:MAG: ATP-binding protein [Lachnospiraceae bacterium]|nr:ATP-binding protein [Lachnospiraceae bacterium]